MCAVRWSVPALSPSSYPLCRRLLKVDVDQAYCVRFPEADPPPVPSGRGGGSRSSWKPMRARRAATKVLLWLGKRLVAVSGVGWGRGWWV